MAEKKYKVSISDTLKAFDKKDRQYYERMTEEQKKEFRNSHFMALRYISSATGRGMSEHHIFYVNELVNQYFSDMKEHPELRWLLMTVCGTGKLQNHQFIKMPSTRKKKSKAVELVAEIFPHLKRDELDLYCALNDKSALKELAKQYGYTDEEIKKRLG